MPVLSDGPVTDAAFAARLDPLAGDDGRPLAVAVSGGPDSTALFHLTDRWTRVRGRDLLVYTVDHGLRPGSGAEAARVAALAAARGRRHRILTWIGDKPANGLQAAARAERYRLMADAGRADGIGDLLLGHHLDDQAETVLQRIGRGTGPDGLAGMAPVRRVDGVRLLRPLLDLPKDRLVATCRAAGLDWVEDPSNRDPRFARTTLRDLAPLLSEAGVTPERLGRLAAAMRFARGVLDRHAADWMAAHAEIRPSGAVVLARPALLAAPPLLRRRLVDRALRAVGGAAYPARGDRLERLMDWIATDGPEGRVRTLGGCRVERDGDRLAVLRDWRQAACPVLVGPFARGRWDGRFDIDNATAAPVRIEVCGEEGWRRWRRTRPDAPNGGVPHAARLALPAVVDLDGGIALPHLVDSAPAASGWVGEAVRVRFRPPAPFP